ncbi:hypothetical protein AB0M94_21630 [Streptomyces xanthochromogenes]|uniref:hypothetical protein n=1 Tax=Streptomyces xanthochromogenes TaxID=67384 RepID=UPI00341CFB43
MTTPFPSVPNDLTAAPTGFGIPQDNPHHRTITDPRRRGRQLDVQMLAVAGVEPTRYRAGTREQFTDVFLLRAPAGDEL